MTKTDGTTVLWYAAEHHPDALVRATVRDHLLAGATPDADESMQEAVTNRLRLEQGTTVEPFVITEHDMAVASDLAHVALGAPNASLQIVSRDKVLPAGGILLKTSLEGHLESAYIERLSTRRHAVASPSRLWRYSPGHDPARSKLIPDGLIKANVTGDDNGFHVRVGPFPHVWGQISAWDDRRGRPLSAPASPSDLGVGVNAIRMPEGNMLRLQPRTAEAAIRFSASMATGSWLLMDLHPATLPIASVAVRLTLPEDGVETALPLVPVLGESALSALRDWLAAPEWTPPPGRDTMMAIGEWLGIPPAWATRKHLEGHS